MTSDYHYHTVTAEEERILDDEEFRNPVNYDEAVNGWLGGVNNMKTEVWWADHNQKRKKE